MTIQSESRLSGPAPSAILSAGMLVPVDAPAANRLPSKWFADKTPDPSPETIRLRAAREVSLGNSWEKDDAEESSPKPLGHRKDSDSDDDGVNAGKTFTPPVGFISADPLSILLADEEPAGEARRVAQRKSGYRAAAKQQLNAAIDSLPEAQRRAVRAVEGVYLANGAFLQAAKHLGLQESTVRRNFARGAINVRKKLEKEWRELFPSAAFCAEHDPEGAWQQSRDQTDTRHREDDARFETTGFLTGERSNAMSKLDVQGPRVKASGYRGNWSFLPQSPANRPYVGKLRKVSAEAKPKNGRYQGGTAHLTPPALR